MILNSESQLRSKLYSWGHWFTSLNIILALIVSCIYVIAGISNTADNNILSLSYLIVYWFGHIAFLSFVTYLIIIFPIIFIFKQIGLVRIWSALVATSALSLMFADSLFYSLNNYHLTFLSQSHLADDFSKIVESIPNGFITAFLVLFAAIFSIQIALANKLWRDLDNIRRWLKYIKLAQAFIICFFISHSLHIWADAKLYKPIIQFDNVLPFSYPTTAKNLLERSNLVDFTEYKNKKNLQFSTQAYQIKQPSFEPSCQAPQSKFQIIVAELNEADFEKAESFLKTQWSSQDISKHYSPVRKQELLFELRYSLPAIYQNMLANTPAMLDLALASSEKNALIALSSDFPTNQALSPIRQTYLNIDYLDTTKAWSATAMKLAKIAEHKSQAALILILPQDRQKKGFLVHQFNTAERPVESLIHNANTSRPDLTSNYDIAPTLMNNWLSCGINQDKLLFGQDLLSNTRSPAWFVSANNNYIYVWDHKLLHSIDKHADVNVQSFSQDKPINKDIDYALLHRAVSKLKQELVKKNAN